MIMRAESFEIRIDMAHPLADLHIHRQCRQLSSDQQQLVRASVKGLVQVFDEACGFGKSVHNGSL